MSESNVCGVLVHVRQEVIGAVSTRLSDLPGVEIHASTPDGRLVVTVEDAGEHRCLETVSQLHDIAGVLSAALVYQHTLQDCNEQESAS